MRILVNDTREVVDIFPILDTLQTLSSMEKNKMREVEVSKFLVDAEEKGKHIFR